MSDPTPREKIEETAAMLRGRAPAPPEVAIILGSGLGPLAERIEDPVEVGYGEIPHFPESTVKGHSGKLVFGRLGGKDVVALKGRFHLYEGWDPKQCTYPVRVFRALGARYLVVSNAAGGVNRHFRIGDLMILDDVVNWQFQNPLIGPNDEELGPRFPDMSRPFSPELTERALEIAREKGIPHHRGVYWALSGPSYETRAELRMFSRMGADAVGMSTVPEVIAAVHGGYEGILGLSCITNLATGEGGEKPTHQEVLDVAKRVEQSFCDLVSGVLEGL